jgi:hypothetical protein
MPNRRTWTFAAVLLSAAAVAGAAAFLAREVAGHAETVYRRDFGDLGVTLRHRHAGLSEEYDKLEFVLHRSGEPVAGPYPLGVAWTTRYRLEDHYFADLEVLLIVERSSPDLVIVAVDLSSGAFWPDYSLEQIPRYAAGNAILARVNASHGTRFEITDLPRLTPPD